MSPAKAKKAKQTAGGKSAAKGEKKVGEAKTATKRKKRVGGETAVEVDDTINTAIAGAKTTLDKREGKFWATKRSKARTGVAGAARRGVEAEGWAGDVLMVGLDAESERTGEQAGGKKSTTIRARSSRAKRRLANDTQLEAPSAREDTIAVTAGGAKKKRIRVKKTVATNLENSNAS